MKTDSLSKLFAHPSFTTKDAAALGISASRLAYYAKKGIIEHVARGVYRNPKIDSSAPFEWQDLLEMAQSVPDGTICQISALSYYNFTQEVQRQFWIAVPHTSCIKRPKTKIIRTRNINLGRVPLKLGEYETFIFDKERTVVEAFKQLSRESAILSLKEYLSTEKPNLSKLAHYGKELRVNIVPYLEALV